MIKHRIKHGIVSLCPRRLIPVLQRWYYPRVVERFSAADWAYYTEVKRLVGQGDTVLDVGANLGCISKLLSGLVGKTGCVYSLEPVPQTYALLCNNVRRLYMDNVQPLNVAASDRPGRVRMVVPTYTGGHENIYESRISLKEGPDDDQHVCMVEARTLDEVTADISGSISFVKIDVEGHELAVLRGAQQLLARQHPALLIEVEGDPDDPDSSAGQLFSLLSEYGYAAYVLLEGNLTLRTKGLHAVDYLFC
ncbi:MAG: FkbM family methyltransferase [Spartobacteria bacterium]|nr:FkbM family methyltransferase [Spartobacteria bacterium]